VQVGRFRAFCPISQIDRLYCQNPEQYVGKQFQFKIIEFKDGGRRFVVSRRALIEAERRQLAEQTRATLQVGDVLDGTVVRLQPFGAFVDIGGLEGLVHVSEFRYERVSNPAQVVQVGAPVRVKVIGIENLGSPDGERISLSVKALAEDPWGDATDVLQPGASLRGTVTRLVNYGAFVQVLPGIEGLVHITEFGVGRIRHPQEVVEEGESVEVKVIEVDSERRRVSLSMRDSPKTLKRPSEPRLDVGTVVEGVVSSIKPYGVFVRIESPQAGVDGLVPSAEADVAEGQEIGDVYPEGAAVKARVVRVDQRGRIRLSVRALTDRRPAARPAAKVESSNVSLGIMADAFKRARTGDEQD
jgi:small subunit ribosomal protein S1